ncbi:hypothetical protein L1049_020207 [Liquidambar formosana]|uniref:Late embryogenesis abundant protein LEA-2 subgroup domain-containing protein n=1 Tax=Liquidambar formosana TaxID=63359 RepID=A0AAP0S9I1_LIQFO
MADQTRRNKIIKCSIIVAIIVVLIAVYLIIVKTIQPRPPRFRVTSVLVSPLNVTALNNNSTSQQITTAWRIDFLITNPHKWESMSYEQVEASVYYRNNFLSSTIILPFNQDRKEELGRRVTVAASSLEVNNGVMNAIAADMSRGAVGFNVMVAARVRVDRSYSWRQKMRGMRVTCEDVKVGLWSHTTAGTMLGEPTPCNVHL